MAPQFFGQYLQRRGVVSSEELVRALELQDKRNADLVELAVREGYLSERDADQVRAKQQVTRASFGDVTRKLALLTSDQVLSLFAKKERERVLLGDALIAIGALDEATRDRELAGFLEERGGAATEDPRERTNRDEQAIAIILRDTSSVLRRLAQERVEEGSLRRASELATAELRMTARVEGDWSGDYVLGASSEIATRLAFHILRDWPGTLPSDVVSEAISELVRVSLTQICDSLSRLGLSCAPSAARRLTSAASAFSGRPIWSKALALPDGAVEVAAIPDR